MHAVAFSKSLPVSDPQALIDIEIDKPAPGPRDLLVKIEAVSVNPVDTKLRLGGDPQGGPRVLGYDAAGTVEAAGADVTLFRPGDAVYYAGSVTRPGTNSEYHLVDERIVGRKPATLDFAEAAAMPLTSITVYELLFDRIGVAMGEGVDTRSLLVIGGAGGVGSMAIQLARVLTGLTVIATASRPETEEWCRSLGAHHIIDHAQPFAPQLGALGIPAVDIILGLTGTVGHWDTIGDVIAPQGRVGVIDGVTTVDISKLRGKSASLHFELMFVRPRDETPDMIAQHDLLNEVADLVDTGRVRTTKTKILSPIDAATLREAHALVESGRTIGKIVVARQA